VKLGCPTKTFLGFAVPRIIVFSTTANAKEANRIAKDLIKRKLAACVNIVPISSHYRWKGKTVHHRECLIIIKTRSEVFARMKGRILALHSYQLPEIVTLKIENGYKPYLEWIDNSVRK
jgi:periplasmic divalent cation tolerance protein